ncbi:MAG: hypothetical protein M3Y81_13935, partial [Chloroflexota bacterium]|nr:hypothetical protein [Chloroflexota bacterium]
IAVRAGLHKPEKYGMRLLAGIIDVFEEFAKSHIIISKLYAVSDTPDGVKLSRDLGFEEKPPVPGSTFNQYILDFNTSDSSFSQEYRSLLSKQDQLT